jgi:hypothetical protein
MSFIPELRNWFFRTNAPLNSEGKRINLQNGSRPDQDLFERLSASVPFKREQEDRAKLNTGGAIEEEVGIVAITTDAKAKDNTSGLETDRTLVVHAGQLPTVDATESDTIEDFNDVALDVTVDGTVDTRNNFLVRLSNAFKTWLGTLRTDLNTAQDDINDLREDVDDLRTLTGTSDGDTDLGTFTGSIISDNTTISNALQELETAIEGIPTFQLGEWNRINPIAPQFISNSSLLLYADSGRTAPIDGSGTVTITGGNIIYYIDGDRLHLKVSANISYNVTLSSGNAHVFAKLILPENKEARVNYQTNSLSSYNDNLRIAFIDTDRTILVIPIIVLNSTDSASGQINFETTIAID